MPRKMLSIEEINEIEERFRQGTATERDIDRLLYTIRRLLPDGAQQERPGRTAKTTKNKHSREKVASQLQQTIAIFTDGACAGNPGPGGWGAIIRTANQEQEMSGGEPRTTNNKMELTAAIEALKNLSSPSHVILTTDSQYVRKGITEWIKRWKVNGWRNASKQPVKNAELWRQLDELNQKHTVEWRWVAGHTGHPENERCDELARRAIRNLKAF